VPRIYLNAALLSLTAFLAAAPSHAQSPAVELEGYFARPSPHQTERAALPVRPCISTTCMLPLPRRNTVDGLARPETRATYDETDASSRPLTSTAPESPRWAARR
jgi:hypothetical protein